MAEIVELAGGMSTFVAEGEVDGGEPPGASALDMEVMAEAVAGDVPGECLDRELVLANAPDHEDGFVRLPPIRRGRTEGGAREETE
ncbi:MAG: Asp-tRNA(Asn)/Glu-tRNA(Gln) amidotransferase subunit GatC [Acidobacteriota bacterium]